MSTLIATEDIQRFKNFLNGHSHEDELICLALKDVLASGLMTETLDGAGVKIFNGGEADLKKILGFSYFNRNNLSNTNRFILFPYSIQDGSTAFTRVKIIPSLKNDEGNEIKYLQPSGVLPIPYIPHAMWEIAQKPNRPLWLLEGEKKALKLLQHGEYAIAFSGVFNFRAGKDTDLEQSKYLWEHLQQFDWSGRVVYIAFDADLWVNPMVKKALWELAIKLYSLDAIIKFPVWRPSEGKGIDDYLVQKMHDGQATAEQIIELLKENSQTVEDFISPDHEEAVLRALPLAELPYIKHERLVKVIAKRLKVSPKTIAIECQKRQLVDNGVGDFTEKEKTEAFEALKDPKLVKNFVDTCHTRYLGRNKELILVKLATISRNFERGTSLMIVGTSSVGKSELVDTVIQTVWGKDTEDFTRISENYLLYRKEGLDHKVIVFNEVHGTHAASHIIRTALTEGILKLGTVVNDPRRGLYSADIEKGTEGLVVISTYASGNIDWELNTRLIKLELSHDPNLARKVLHHKAKPKKDNKESFRLLRIADSLLEPLEVVIPYNDKLANLFPVHEERHMRDFDKVLNLIKASALWHQHQREKDSEGRVIANINDYKIVYSLRSLITQSVSQVSDQIKRFLETAESLKSGKEAPIREEIRERLNVSDATIKRYVKECSQKDLIEVDGKGKKQRINVLEIPQDVYPLSSPKEMFGSVKEPLSQKTENLDIKGSSSAQARMTHSELQKHPESAHSSIAQDSSKGSEPTKTLDGQGNNGIGSSGYGNLDDIVEVDFAIEDEEQEVEQDRWEH